RLEALAEQGEVDHLHGSRRPAGGFALQGRHAVDPRIRKDGGIEARSLLGLFRVPEMRENFRIPLQRHGLPPSAHAAGSAGRRSRIWKLIGRDGMCGRTVRAVGRMCPKPSTRLFLKSRCGRRTQLARMWQCDAVASITFLGAAQTVTGSRHLLTTASGKRILIDAGLFQGRKDLRLRNWEPWTAGKLDAVILTHAHIDHTGFLPRLCAQGVVGRVVCTEATRELAWLLLPDSGHLQEADAMLLECTYGDRTHPREPPGEELQAAILDAMKRGGPLLIPAFAIGRTQEILFLWRRLEHEGRIPKVPVFVDSPMATDATPL